MTALNSFITETGESPCVKAPGAVGDLQINLHGGTETLSDKYAPSPVAFGPERTME